MYDCATARMNGSQESSLTDVCIKGRRTKTERSWTPPIFTAREADLADQTVQTCEIELVATPGSDSTAGGVETDMIKKFSKVTKVCHVAFDL